MKKVNRFTEIKNIVSTLSRAEKEVVLRLFETHRNMETALKGAILVSAISDQPDISESQLIQQIDYSGNKEGELSAFYMFVRSVILESLTLDINLERPGEYSNQFRNKVSGSKKLLQAQILLGKGLYQEALKLTEEVKSKVEKYQQLDLLYECTHMQSICNSAEGSGRAFKKSMAESEAIALRRNRLKKAQLIFLNAHFKFKKLNKASEGEILNIIAQLKEINKVGAQAKIQFYISILTTKYEMRIGNFTAAKNTLEAQLELIRNSPILQSVERESHILLKLSIVLLHLQKYNETKSVLDWTNHLVKKSSFDHFVVLKRQIYLDFYLNKFDDLNETIEHSIKSKYTRRLPFAIFRIQFFKAVHALFTNEAKICVKILNEEIKLKQPYSNDLKLGQAVFLFIAANELDQTDKQLKVEALQTCESSLNELADESLRKRDVEIVKIFKKFIANPQELVHPSEALTRLLAKLKSTNSDMRWEPFTYEIIPINTWYNSRTQESFKNLAHPNGDDGILEGA